MRTRTGKLLVVATALAMMLSGVWIFKYIRYSPGLASLRRVITDRFGATPPGSFG